MTKVLELKFSLADNSSLTLTIPKPKSDLTVAQINEAMDTMVASNCIARKGNTITGKKEARFVERNVNNVVLN